MSSLTEVDRSEQARSSPQAPSPAYTRSGRGSIAASTCGMDRRWNFGPSTPVRCCAADIRSGWPASERSPYSVVAKAGRLRPRGGSLSRRACRAVKGALVSTSSGDEERAWAADKRDFVADRRDEVADQRDRVADTRDRTADDSEAQLDKWEQQLDERAAQLGVSAEASEVSAQRAEAGAERSQARQNRDEARTKRMTA